MRIGNKEEHQAVVAILDSLLVNKKQVISRNMIRNNAKGDDYKKIENHLGDYLADKNPIYLYIKYGDIYFQIRYQNQIVTGFDEYDEAKMFYRKIQRNELTVQEINDRKRKKKDKRVSTVITLEDGFKRMLEKHMNEYEAGNVKYSSYTKKGSTIKYHILPWFEGIPIDKITEADIEKFVDQIKYNELSNKHKKGEERKLSVAMQSEVFMYFKKLYKTTKRYFNIKTDIDIDEVMEDIAGKSNLKRARKQYNREVGKVIEGVYSDLETLFPTIKEIENSAFNPIIGIQLLIYYTGMRIDEVIALKPADYDPDEKELTISKSVSWHPNKKKTKKSYEVTSTKTWEDRTILLPDSICKYLDVYISRLGELSYYSDDMYIFSRLGYARTDNELLDPFSLKTYTNHMRKAYIHSGLKAEEETIPKNHYARHAFNTLLEKNKIADYDRKVYLGHSPGMGVNEGYTHKSRKEEEKIVEIADNFCRNFVEDD